MKKLPKLFFAVLPIGYVELLWLANGQQFNFSQAIAVSLVSLTAFFLPETILGEDTPVNFRVKSFRMPGMLLLGGSVFFLLIDGLSGVLAFLGVTILAAILLLVSDLVSGKKFAVAAVGFAAGLGLVYGLGIVGVLQIIERFSEEEFFAGIQLALISGWWFLVWLGRRRLRRLGSRMEAGKSSILQIGLFILLLLLLFSGAVLGVNEYQANFFPQQAESFPGITNEQPFICSELTGASGEPEYDSREIFRGIAERALQNPTKTAVDWGMLALITPDATNKEAFRQEILKDARAGRYTGPAGSIKFGQYETALRVYFFHEIDRANPMLFQPGEKAEIRNWFAAVNQRSLTVEWVDWMYALAFGEWPEGPYLNQENGAGLLALLESYHYGDPLLAVQNNAFLQKHAFGWDRLFRNTDDSIYYQALWINNALFQAIYRGSAPEENLKKSFEWMLLQATPDGSPFGYNPNQISLATAAYLGAQLTGDGRFLWLAGRSLEFAEQHNLPLYYQPGLAEPLRLESKQPTLGSCLIYGNSGTPVRFGPLAADKIVFRDGWEMEDRYLNLNLRFTGWHRYKATNSIISIYQAEPLVIERTDAPAATWLPVGRSIFRDKRMPRENLNGLVIQRQGLSRLVFWMSGFGSPWAQDPPYYAVVEKFQPEAEMDISVTKMAWNGWTQTRIIYFIHDGPIVVVDEADGPENQVGGIAWHVIAPAPPGGLAGEPIRLGKSGNGMMHLVPLDQGGISFMTEDAEMETKVDILFQGKGRIGLVTLITSGKTEDLKFRREKNALKIILADREVEIPLHSLDFRDGEK